ncbi:unnamed protein product [Leptosia nina]|uniref:JmjC domain-containing protein n=1 Tax=Leptosia nina TaxID=320188 RepID=A0AAV1JUD1_9NEOP
MSTAEICEKLKAFKPQVETTIEQLNDLDKVSLSVLKTFISDTTLMKSKHSFMKIQAVLDYMHEQINIGNWKDVRLFLRKTITIASYLKVLAILVQQSDLTDSVIKEVYGAIDFGIMFGCPISSEPELLQKCGSILTSVTSQNCTYETDNKIDSQIECVHIEKPSGVIDIDVITCPSMEYFYKNVILQKRPVILENCIDHWPALSKWKDSNYFIKLAGLRTVPIEIGREYTDPDWTQKLILMKDFIKTYIYQDNGPKGYLAQYALFEQIPELKKDIIEPEYCSFSETDEPVNVMAWFGPKGTVSPLHHDPTKNLLTQVVGEKRIYLFSPSDSEYLYPHESDLLDNTARVDPRNPKLGEFPNYTSAKPYYCVLKPGQMLYIPPKWWHFVESLSISFSVSFWWT